MNAPNVSGWKPGTPEAPTGESGVETVTGNRALMLEEPLIFEIGDTATTGVDFEPSSSPATAGAQSESVSGPRPASGNRIGGLERHREIGLAGLTEPQTVRHYTRLSRQNYAIDLGLFPLGSCTSRAGTGRGRWRNSAG